MFKALLLTKENDRVDAKVEWLADHQLPEGDVLVDVHYSTLNYKDALIIHDKVPLVRRFPHVPGIDLAGVVAQSGHADFQPGDSVVLNGWGIGERHWGGLAGRARVKADWLIRIPKGWTPRQAMAVGTAGYTAMLAILSLEDRGMAPGKGEVLVTGAAGGVGSIAIALLARKGYEVVASSGRASLWPYLQDLGAASLIDRAEFAADGSRPLEKARFQACIDSVAGPALARVLGQLVPGGCLAAIGNAGGNSFQASVIPFLLRGVALLGIDSVYQPIARRELAWQRLADDLDLEKLELASQDAALEQVVELGRSLLAGEVRGRIVVDVRQ